MLLIMWLIDSDVPFFSGMNERGEFDSHIIAYIVLL